MFYIDLGYFKNLFTDRDFADLTDNKQATELTTLLTGINERVVSRVHGYLRGRYAIPLPNPVDELITGVVGDLMKCALYRRRDELNLPESILKLEKDSYAELEKISKGSITIAVVEENTNDEEILVSHHQGKVVIGLTRGNAKFPSGFLGFNN